MAVPFLATGQFSASGVASPVSIFGLFYLGVWGTPLGGNGEPGTFTGTVLLERSTDGGATWLPCSVDGTGALAQYTAAALVQGLEVEAVALYRLNCTSYSSGTINWRLAGSGLVVR